MQFHGTPPNSPFVESSIAFGNRTCLGYHSCKKHLLERFLATNSTMVFPMTGDLESPQYAKHQLHQNNSQLHCHTFTETQEQQQLDLLSDMHPENIFNSESSILVYPDIPQASSVHSFMDVNTSSHITSASRKNNCSSVESTMDQEGFLCGTNSGEATSALSTQSLLNYPTMVSFTTSLDNVVNFKRKNIVRQQNSLFEFNPSHAIDESASMFVNSSKFPLVRGYRCGGTYDRPPSKRLLPGTKYVSVRLRLKNVSSKELCAPQWNVEEIKDNRRIIRIERRREFNEVVASFSIVGSATENPKTAPSPEPEVDVLEVSCLQWPIDESKYIREHDKNRSPSQKQLHASKLSGPTGGGNRLPGSSGEHQYYITSVEVIKIIELLVGNHSIPDGQQKRNERARIRSNLVPFWSKYSLSSPKDSLSAQMEPAQKEDKFSDLVNRIMSYKVRKPRVFNKNVRIMEWSELGPALQRALQSYYVAVPQNDQKSD